MSKFEELRDKRLSVALRKIELLGNLGRASYGATDIERREIVGSLQAAVDGLRRAYKLPTAHHVPAEVHRPSGVPSGTAEGGAAFEAEVRWTIDAIQRGDTKLALSRLKRYLTPSAYSVFCDHRAARCRPAKLDQRTRKCA